jgi:hypothetical protein
VSDGLLAILKFCLFALLYLFLARVVWTVVSEMRGAPAPVAAPVEPRPAPARAKPAPRRPWRLVVVEPLEASGRVFEVDGEITIGRAAGCGVSIPDDTFVSNVHARVFERSGDVLLEDLGSTNGTLVDGASITALRTLRKGDRIQVGQTVLEVAR